MGTPQLTGQINDAIGAHGLWKMRLRTAIRMGSSDVTPEVASCDDRCQFGQWLHGSDLSAQVKADVPYQVVRRLHADFHRTAGTVLRDALMGRTADAQTRMEGEFTERSDKLIRALNKWKREQG